MDTSRQTAVQALLKQEQDGYANLVLNSVFQKAQLNSRDLAFASAVFYGTVERQITLDYILQQFMNKPLSKADAQVRAILRSGLYQARYMSSVPISAAVNESVKLVRSFKKTSASGMVNAVLRKAANFKLEEVNFKNEIQRLSVVYSVSEPIVKCIQASYGEKTEDILNSFFVKPVTSIRVNTNKISQDKLKAQFEHRGIKVEDGLLANSLHINLSGDISQLDLFKQGLFHVQGQPSQFACAVLAPTKGSKVLDLCAAPGGKSATLAQYMKNEGELICSDFAKNRLSLIEKLLERNDVKCAKICHADASIYNKDLENADFVLCDVPCSGIGIIAKKPDIRYKNLKDISQLINLQKQIIQTASRYVKKGGKLVYSTCTINCEENDNIVMNFLKENDKFKLVKTKINNLELDGKKGYTFLPNSDNCDGFYIALLERL